MGDAGAIAAGVARALRDGRFAEVEALFAAPLRAVAPAGAVSAAWAAEIARHGPVTSVGDPAAEPLGTDLTRVSVPVACERGALTVVMSVDGAGLLNGLRLAPGGAEAWSPPPYADPSAFEEREVTVGSGPLAVPGTLTLPRGTGPHPGTVLLAGGGPFDRDATSGPNKPLKDLAWGLATSGVAVLRFDKATCAHPAEVAADPAFTMADEYVPHAVAAVRLLRDDPAVDAGRVFVLGHSMGGKAAPRVAAAEPSVAGLVIMAGDAQPMHEAAVRVTRYLASLDPGPDADAAVAAITRQAARVADPALSPADPAADLPFGLSAPYWLDMRSYDPVATALAVGKPMLILQGGRDYQVTVEDDLSRWRAALEGRPGVTVRVHAADDHLFFPGTGPSTPAGYDRPQHVDPAVLDDIAAWLNA
ncbi:Esterase EstD [Actinomadura sp. RB99]|uniref:alpha/beta hydrolase family protein n=1 Tax=Actinomadura sp. RB99 TaxID=2691577 RepID=UPI001683DEE5|nr:alpha/beta hydrolase [Actinomadura sp. RB99]MBD2897767.1 Esterase EstD [Actinomadura sp. RB99]